MIETTNKNMLIDTVILLPEVIDCYLQAPSLDNIRISNLMQDSKFDYFKLFTLNSETKKILIDEIKSCRVDRYFSRIELRENDKLLFEGFDGCEYGNISNAIKLPSWFIEEYISNGTCRISGDW